MDQSVRFSREDLKKIECYAKIEVGLFPGSQLFFSGKIDSVLSNSPHPIHGTIIRLENMLIGRILSLMNKEEYLLHEIRKTKDETFLEMLLFENIRYEKQIYDNVEDHLSEMTHQSNLFHDAIQGINDDETIEKIRKLTLKKDAEIEKQLIKTHNQLKEKFEGVEQTLTEKSPKPLSLDYDKIDDLYYKISEFEKSCRSLIVLTLSKEENWWKQKIPKDVRTYALETKEKNGKKINYSKSQGDLINFINLPDIQKIILSNKKDFESITNWDEFKVYMDKIGIFRKELAHSRELEIRDKHHLNYCISNILQMLKNNNSEYIMEDGISGPSLNYKKPIPENYIPKDFIKIKNNFKLKKGFLSAMKSKVIGENLLYQITKNPKKHLICLSNWAKTEKIPIVHLECNSEMNHVELIGRRNYTLDKDGNYGVELGALKLANELSKIHGSAILFLENIGSLNPNYQKSMIREFLEYKEIQHTAKIPFGMRNHEKLIIVGTDESNIISDRLSPFSFYFNDFVEQTF